MDEEAYVHNADWRIRLTERGRQQARAAGKAVMELIGPEANLHVYVSPYARTRETLAHMLESVPEERVVRLREDPRISEQQFGNFQNVAEVQQAKRERATFGRFYYRFPNGESGLDVYARVSSFVSTLFRDHGFARTRRAATASEAATDTEAWRKDTVLVVTHGLTLRLLLMRYFQWSVRAFEQTSNPDNAQLVVLERQPGVEESTPGHFTLVRDAGILAHVPHCNWEAEGSGRLRLRDAPSTRDSCVSAGLPPDEQT